MIVGLQSLAQKKKFCAASPLHDFSKNACKKKFCMYELFNYTL